ncbi:MAG: efflux RND transporter periplasmic adaptor subunit [Prevotellaceae bacterium]|jgi:membrane fusion protein (multidrug efflux system)|nr:efflux RND transporter periplasmic adaptor subunit [Prevotellaceae bacterium]
MNKGTRITLIVIVILFIVGMFVYPQIKKALFKTEFDDSMKNPAASAASARSLARVLPVSAVVIKPTTISDKINSTGTLLPEEEVDLSFEASGKITGIFFTEGTFVKEGTLLAKINDSRLQAQLQKLENQLKLAESREFRQKALLAKDAVSQESYDQITTEVENYKADIALVKAQIIETELRAPFDGIIGLRQVSEGAYASPSLKIAKLTKIIPLKLQFSIPERYVSYVQKGTPVTFYLDDLMVHNATVYATDSKIDEATRTVLVRALYPNNNGRLAPGSFANVSVQLSQINDGIAVPSQSLIPEMGKQTVYLYKNGKAEPVEVSLGIRTEINVQVTKGLSVGDTVITTGILQLRKGLPVAIENLKPKADNE